MIKENLERVFRFTIEGQNVMVTDPNPSASPERVMTLLSNQYGELTTATVKEIGIENDKMVYEFLTVVCEKG